MEEFTGGGEGQRSVGAVQQYNSQRMLQLGQILAKIGLGEIETLGSLGNTALFHDGQEIFGVFDEHFTAPRYNNFIIFIISRREKIATKIKPQPCA
jgi:hypothetical protein